MSDPLSVSGRSDSRLYCSHSTQKTGLLSAEVKGKAYTEVFLHEKENHVAVVLVSVMISLELSLSVELDADLSTVGLIL